MKKVTRSIDVYVVACADRVFYAPISTNKVCDLKKAYPDSIITMESHKFSMDLNQFVKNAKRED